MGWMRQLCVIGLLAALAAGGKGDKPRRYIDWAPTWNDAVEEAQALNMPIVVHRHGFY